MKNVIKLIGIIALAAMIGFAFITCDDGNNNNGGNPTTDPGSGQFSGTDVKGNTYSLSVGSDASRAAKKGDRFNMNITVGGSQKTVDGTVEEISTDGTLTLKADGSTETFTAVVGGATLNSVAGNGEELAQIPVSGGGTFIPRTFDKIYLRATRWDGPNVPTDAGADHQYGEHYGSGKTILLKDFASNVTQLEADTEGRYLITLRGTSNVKLDYITLEIQGIDAAGNWHYLGGGGGVGNFYTVKANEAFTIGIPLNIWEASGTLSAYNEVICQITNVFKYTSTLNPDWSYNNGSIPANIPDGQITATFSNFSIAFIDTDDIGVTGDLGNYTFGFYEDGISINPGLGLWENLSEELITKATTEGAKLEFTFGVDVSNQPLVLVWQSWEVGDDGVWWQDTNLYTETGWISGVTYNATTKKLTVPLSLLKDYNDFKELSESLNFIIAWWGGNIFDLDIKSVNIVTTP